MSKLVVLASIALSLAGCAGIPTTGSAPLSPSDLSWFAQHGYHTAPYDNTGNGPGETGMEGGGG
jgi:hypothetical protein